VVLVVFLFTCAKLTL
jgi:hypothetical protein